MEAKETAEAYSLALRRLSRREHSAQEMAAYLESRGVAEKAASAIVAELIESKLIDDERFARILTRYQALRGKGPHYIVNKLRQKGVALETSEVRQLVEAAHGTSELEIARQIVAKRYPEATRELSEQAKAYQALIRRGFSHEIARRATRDSAA